MSPEPADLNQCRYLNSRGQRCRMLLASDGDSLCPFHLRLSKAAPNDPEILAAELLEGTGNLNTADRVNVLLGNLVNQLAHKRINRQDALAIGYLAQLMLNSVPEIQKEYQAIRAAKAREALRKSVAELQAGPSRQPAETPASSQARLPQFAFRQAAQPQLAASPSVKEQKVAAPLPSSASQFSEQVLLETVLQATAPQRP